MDAQGDFWAGVIEGFYGQPWSRVERLELFGWMQDWGLNTYFYAPKDDLKHRALWRQLYSEAEAAALREVIVACGDIVVALTWVGLVGFGLDRLVALAGRIVSRGAAAS